MEIDLHSILIANPLLLLFTVIGTGYLLGKISLLGIPLGSTPGILLTGLLFGHFGFASNTQHAAAFGFTLFIFTVGLQAGPSFFSAFLEDGRRFFLMALIVAISALSIVLTITVFVDFEYGLEAGLMAGALTSTPMLAAAQDAITSGLAALPEKMDPETALNNIGAAYAITYIFGAFGLTVFIHSLPRLLNIDLAKSALEYTKKRGLLNKSADIKLTAETVPIIRAYQVSNEAVGKTIEQRSLDFGKKGKAISIRRGKKILAADNDLVIEKGDIISFIASIAIHEKAQTILGNEILDPDLISIQLIEKQIVVINQAGVDKSFDDLEMDSKFGCFPTKLIRAGIVMPVDGHTIIQKGDIICVTGEESNLTALAEKLGYFEGELEHTDLITLAFGIVAGLLIGTIVLKFGNLSFGLGSAGGLLIVGIILGFLSSVHPTFGLMPAAAKKLLMDFGLAIFMAAVGLGAGEKVVEAILTAGLPLILSGVVLTIVPVLIAYAFGRYILNMNTALLFGAMAGSMTSTPALKVVTDISRSYVPSIGYAGTYTFANVFLTFAGSILLLI